MGALPLAGSMSTLEHRDNRPSILTIRLEKQ